MTKYHHTIIQHHTVGTQNLSLFDVFSSTAPQTPQMPGFKGRSGENKYETGNFHDPIDGVLWRRRFFGAVDPMWTLGPSSKCRTGVCVSNFFNGVCSKKLSNRKSWQMGQLWLSHEPTDNWNCTPSRNRRMNILLQASPSYLYKGWTGSRPVVNWPIQGLNHWFGGWIWLDKSANHLRGSMQANLQHTHGP